MKNRGYSKIGFSKEAKRVSDSVKYCYADTRIEYMCFLEECRKAEDESK